MRLVHSSSALESPREGPVPVPIAGGQPRVRSFSDGDPHRSRLLMDRPPPRPVLAHMRVTQMVESLGQSGQSGTLIQGDQALYEPIVSRERQRLDQGCHRLTERVTHSVPAHTQVFVLRVVYRRRSEDLRG